MDHNRFYGVHYHGDKFTTEGIIALCEGLKKSKVSSLRCMCQLATHLRYWALPHTALRITPFGLNSLDNNYMGSHIDDDGCWVATPEGPKVIMDALPHCPNLQSLR